MDEDNGAQLTISLEGDAQPPWLSLNQLGNGQAELVGVPANEDVGVYDIHLRVRDGALDQGGLMDEQFFQITVANVNDGPQITSVPVGIDAQGLVEVDEDSAYIYTLTATDPDPKMC